MRNNDLRQEYRLNTPLTVFIELTAADNNSPSSIVISHSLDISTNGLRVITDRELPIGSIFQSCIQCNTSMNQFKLASEVKWSRPFLDQGEYFIGLAFSNTKDADIQAWREFISEQYAQDNL